MGARFPDRYPRAPWGYPMTDLRAQGPPEHQTFVGDGVLLWLHVRQVPGRHPVLAVRWDGTQAVGALMTDGDLVTEDGA